MRILSEVHLSLDARGLHSWMFGAREIPPRKRYFSSPHGSDGLIAQVTCMTYRLIISPYVVGCLYAIAVADLAWLVKSSIPESSRIQSIKPRAPNISWSKYGPKYGPKYVVSFSSKAWFLMVLFNQGGRDSLYSFQLLRRINHYINLYQSISPWNFPMMNHHFHGESNLWVNLIIFHSPEISSCLAIPGVGRCEVVRIYPLVN